MFKCYVTKDKRRLNKMYKSRPRRKLRPISEIGRYIYDLFQRLLSFYLNKIKRFERGRKAYLCIFHRILVPNDLKITIALEFVFNANSASNNENCGPRDALPR